MLKIKQGTTLDQLQKFGFKWYQSKSIGNNYVYFLGINIVFSISPITRKIKISNCKQSYDILFDLITAGLVEKVEQ